MVLLAGRLTNLKGVKDLLLWLLSDDNDAKLVLTADPENDIGAARLYHWFKQNKVEHRVIWVGWQSAMANLYALADVVVSPSTRAESFGRTVVESLAIGTPVVAYNHGGVGEILGRIFPQGKVETGNQQQLANKINQVLEKCPVIVDKQPYLLSTMLSQTMALYQDMAHDNE
jgi:glycosyltransferase involved in cell wall biosynthesis